MPINPLNRLLNSKIGKIATDPRAAGGAAAIATVSNLTKDIVNCYYYVHQSLHNDRIPEDKRKFVAGLDLSNGILNVIVQTGASVLLNKHIGDFFDKKIAPKHFSPEKFKKLCQSPEEFEELASTLAKQKGFAKVGLSVISTLVVMQVIAKRIIVPLIATPLATVFKKQFEKSGAKNEAVKPVNNSINSDKKVTENITNKNNYTNIYKGKTPDCFKTFVNNYNNDKIKG